MSEERVTAEDADRWIDFWGNQLCLNGWTIKTRCLKRDKERSCAKIDWSEGYCAATLTLWPCFFRGSSRYGAWRIICHEMLHLCFAPVYDELCQQIGDRIVYNGFNRQMERAIDRLAGALAAVTPIPEPTAACPPSDGSPSVPDTPARPAPEHR